MIKYMQINDDFRGAIGLEDNYISKRKRFWAEIDLDAAESNFSTIRRGLPSGVKLCCVVKANAYGHGAVYLSRLYERLGADFFAVSNIEEAMQLRDGGISTPILILGYTPVSCAAILAENNISQTVFSPSYARELSQSATSHGVSVKMHIKLDTGMGRIGFDCTHGTEAVLPSLVEACKLPGLVPEGIFTHFALADEGEDGESFTRLQYGRFISAVDALAERGITFELRHCANSAASLDYPEYCLDMVRAGVVLYGISPSDKIRNSAGLIPVMSLRAVISMVKEIDEGDTVSYGCTYRAPSKRLIATVPVGYADGFWRSNAESGTQMLVRGRRVGIVGRVCMDQLMLDVSDVCGVSEGDYVTVIGSDGGERIDVSELARNNHTIGYELVCAIGERVPRFYLSNGRIVHVKDSIISYEISE